MQQPKERRIPYWGKIAGVAAGLATGRLWLALIGLILGHQFDRGYAHRFARPRAETKERTEHLPADFVRSLFRTMGFLAKADGRVSEAEIRAARVLMHRLGLGPSEIKKSIDWFEEGKQPSFPLHDTLRRLRRDTTRHTELRTAFVRLLLEVALSKKSLHRRERAAIWTICSELDIGRVELAQLEAMLRAQSGFRRSAAGGADADRVTSAYEVLGVHRSSTNDEIKRAYRRLMNKNHPDKLAAAAGDAALASEASKRTREIRGAYEMLKARRSIR
ncbi:MAG: co-chaperone DjlA [Woeseia sp.]